MSTVQLTADITLLHLSDLVRAKWNPQIHDADNVQAIKRSIIEFGLVVPFLVRRSDLMIVAGHGRATALEELWAEGWVSGNEDTVPVVLGEWDEVEVRALSVALNRIQSGADAGMIGNILLELRQSRGAEWTTVTGFTETNVLGAHRFETPRQLWADEGTAGDGQVSAVHRDAVLTLTLSDKSKQMMTVARRECSLELKQKPSDDEFWTWLLDKACVDQ